MNTTKNCANWRNEEFDYKKHRWFFRHIRALFITAVFFIIGVIIYANDTKTASKLDGYIQNIFATIVGTVYAVTYLDSRAKQNKELDLIAQMGSRSNDFAVEAARLLLNAGLLTDGSLRGTPLHSADLHGANLLRSDLSGSALLQANLSNAHLMQANLSNANLSLANLSGAKLGQADLRRTELWHAYLIGADLTLANLTGANLRQVDLRDALLLGANMTDTILMDADLSDALLNGVNFTGANLRGTKFGDNNFLKWSGETSIQTIDNETILPDGKPWNPQRDMTQFTDPEGWMARKASTPPSHPPNDPQR